MSATSLNDALIDMNVEFGAGRLCLDFANTVDWHASAQPIELLPTYAHLLAWAQLRDALDAETASALMESGAMQPDAAERVRQRAVALREAIYGIFSARHRGREVAPAHIATIDGELQRAFDHLHVMDATTDSGNAYVWEWRDTAAALDAPLWSVSRSIADLLTSPDMQRVRECAGDPCGWLFLDTSRNRSRRWCTMESCGNRAKARRHYERSRVMRPTA